MVDTDEYEALVYMGVKPRVDDDDLWVVGVDNETFYSLVEKDIIGPYTHWDGFDEEKGHAVGGQMGYVESADELKDELD